MAEQKLYRVELRVTTTLHVEVTAANDGEAKKLARTQVEQGACFPAPPHKLKAKIVAVDELPLASDPVATGP